MDQNFPKSESLRMQVEAHMMDEAAQEFHSRMAEYMQEGRDIVVFRGAGTKNGISPSAVEQVTSLIKRDIQERINSGRKVVIMLDGDADDRGRPDIGAIFGIVADAYAENGDVSAIAVQKRGWYYPQVEGDVLRSAFGAPYETFVFPDELPGSHSALTQSEELARYDKYSQVFVGPVGEIGSAQLSDLNTKAEGRGVNKVPVRIIATANNEGLTEHFQNDLRIAQQQGNESAVVKHKTTLRQRRDQPYGAFYSANGKLTLDPREYGNLDIIVDETFLKKD